MRIALLSLVLAGALLAPARAHDTWLASRERTVAGAQPMELELTSGSRFPTAGSAPKVDRVARAGCRQRADELALVPGKRDAKTQRFEVAPPERAGLVCWLELKPKELALAVAKVDHYLDEIDASEAVRRAWAASPEPRRWVETYSKHSKTIVPGTVAAVDADRPVGMTLEFVPLVDVSTGRVPGDLAVRVLKDGKPLAGLRVELVSGKDSRGLWRTTDVDGLASFGAPTPGRWLLRGTDLRSTDASQGTWESHFATLVFDVLPPSPTTGRNR